MTKHAKADARCGGDDAQNVVTPAPPDRLNGLRLRKFGSGLFLVLVELLPKPLAYGAELPTFSAARGDNDGLPF